MRKTLPISLIFIFFISQVLAQKLSYGPAFGLIYENNSGISSLDSVQVVTQSGEDPKIYLGGYITYQLTRLFFLTAGLNYYNDATSYIVYNAKDDCAFCPIVKATIIGHPSLEMPFLLEMKVSFLPINIFFTLGIVSNVRLSIDGDNFYLYKGAGEQVSEVLYSLHTAIKPILWDYSLGLGLKVWRLRIEGRYQHNLSGSATNAITVWGNHYNLISNKSTVRFGIFYNLKNDNRAK